MLFRSPRLYQWGKQVSEETANAIRLAHGAAEFNEDYNRLIMEGNPSIEEDGGNQDKLGVHPWFQGNKRALLADFVIGTVDQFLMASLKRKHFMLRHMGLAGKVVVIDECHAYDAYMNIYIWKPLCSGWRPMECRLFCCPQHFLQIGGKHWWNAM